MVKLRGHHLICIHGFEGEGYSDRFVEKAWQVKQSIQDPDCLIKISSTEDELCGQCDYWSSPSGTEVKICGHPDFGHSVDKQDREVTEKLGLAVGQEIQASDLKSRIGKEISLKDLEELCGKCPWLDFGYCLEAVKSLGEKHVVGS